MARLAEGLLGPFIGKVGNLVGYIRYGQSIVRINGHNPTKPRSAAQRAVNEKFKVVMAFISPINNFINVSFRLDIIGTGKNPQNAAVSYNVMHAVKGTSPDFEMDYSKALVSKGDLPGAVNPAAELIAPGILKFKWDADVPEDWSRWNDKVMLLAYYPEAKQVYYVLSGAKRSKGEDVLEIEGLNNSLKDQAIETYIAFITDDRERISDSQYTGRIDL